MCKSEKVFLMCVPCEVLLSLDHKLWTGRTDIGESVIEGIRGPSVLSSSRHNGVVK